MRPFFVRFSVVLGLALAGCEDSVKVTIKVKTASDASAAAATGTDAGLACCQAETATKAVP